MSSVVPCEKRCFYKATLVEAQIAYETVSHLLIYSESLAKTLICFNFFSFITSNKIRSVWKAGNDDTPCTVSYITFMQLLYSPIYCILHQRR